MDRPNATSEDAASCLAILESASGPMVAAEIAARLGLGASRESQRRYVREIITHLRESGCKVVADQRNGYFLTDDDRQWRDYLEGRQIEAKRVLGETHKKKKLTYPDGTLAMFGQRVTTGIG